MVSFDAERRPARLVGGDARLLVLTGLPGAGKTTLAIGVQHAITGAGEAAWVIDGDRLRTGLCTDLGFSESDRLEQARRAACVARMALDVGMHTIVAMILPTHRSRQIFWESVGPGDHVLVHVATPLAVCEARDPKGLYARARRGELPGFTGVGSPYEVPEQADLCIDTALQPLSDSVVCLASLCLGRQRTGQVAMRTG